MAVKVGDVVYLWVHAYFRVVGEVTEILGVRRVALKDASVIHGDSEGYEAFFRRGVSGKTTTLYVGEIQDTCYMVAIDFPFDLPTRKQ